MNPLTPSPGREPAPPTMDDVIVQLARTNKLLAEQIALTRNWKIALRNGLFTGLGGVLGATVVLSLVFAILRPLQRLSNIGPVLERIERDVRDR